MSHKEVCVFVCARACRHTHTYPYINSLPLLTVKRGAQTNDGEPGATPQRATCLIYIYLRYYIYIYII